MQLIVENLVQQRGGRTVVDHVSFVVASGEAFALTGPNGAGKTTLLRTLAGFMAPVSGSISLSGADPETPIAEQCHYIGHLNGLKSNLTAGENVAFWAEFLSQGPINAGAVFEALDFFEVGHLANIPAGYLSAGQKRRVALSRLLAAKRAVWFLDEPTVSLDAASSKLVVQAVNRHTGAGGIVVAATHLALDLDKAKELRLGVKEATA